MMSVYIFKDLTRYKKKRRSSNRSQSIKRFNIFLAMTEDHKCVVSSVKLFVFLLNFTKTVIEIVETFMSSDKIIIPNNFIIFKLL